MRMSLIPVSNFRRVSTPDDGGDFLRADGGRFGVFHTKGVNIKHLEFEVRTILLSSPLPCAIFSSYVLTRTASFSIPNRVEPSGARPSQRAPRTLTVTVTVPTAPGRSVVGNTVSPKELTVGRDVCYPILFRRMWR
jgi:hypothetical protein